MPNPFDMATRAIYRNPHIGQMGVDNPSVITIVYPDGTRRVASPLAQPVSEFERFGEVSVQSRAAKIISVRTSEVPVQPPSGSTVEGYQIRYYVETSELSDTELEWRLDLQGEV
jgi:hypothetical protein